MNYNPYFNLEEFQKFKYFDQPALKLLDWALDQIKTRHSFENPKILREQLKKCLVDQIELDLNKLKLRLEIGNKFSQDHCQYVEYSLHIGNLFQSKATVAIPDQLKDKSPLFICLHGHQHEGRRWTLNKGPAAALTKAGFVCVAPDLVGLGDSRGKTENMQRGAVAYDLLVHNSLFLGWGLNGLRLWILQKWMKKLSENREVSKLSQNFACAGFSLGAEIALLLAAIDTKINPVYISHYCCPWENAYWSKLHCTCAYQPGLLRITNLLNVFKLIAPRNLAIEAGEKDRSFPWDYSQKLISDVEKFYAKHSANQNFNFVIKDDDHVFHCASQTLDFLIRKIDHLDLDR